MMAEILQVTNEMDYVNTNKYALDEIRTFMIYSDDTSYLSHMDPITESPSQCASKSGALIDDVAAKQRIVIYDRLDKNVPSQCASQRGALIDAVIANQDVPIRNVMSQRNLMTPRDDLTEVRSSETTRKRRHDIDTNRFYPTSHIRTPF
jgi:hypothetical protein